MGISMAAPKRKPQKVMHINLHDDQVDDYLVVREATGITNDNDLIRHLLRIKARELRFQQSFLVDSSLSYAANVVGEPA